MSAEFQEEWRTVAPHPNYEVSDLGNVRLTASKKPKRVTITQGGQAQVGLHPQGVTGITRTFFVHKLVMEAFVGPLPKNNFILHIDGNKIDCTLKNLAYSHRVKHPLKTERSCVTCKSLFLPSSGRQIYRKASCNKRRPYKENPCINILCKSVATNGRACPKCASRFYHYKTYNPDVRKVGKKKVDRQGYVALRYPNHPNANKTGYVFEHRMVMSDYLGRPLRDQENVHHINGDRKDNRLENLELWVKPQASGQRAEDLVEFVVNMYPDEVEVQLAISKTLKETSQYLAQSSTQSHTASSALPRRVGLGGEKSTIERLTSKTTQPRMSMCSRMGTQVRRLSRYSMRVAS